MSDPLHCVECGHSEEQLDELGMCTAPGCRCVCFRAIGFDDDDDSDIQDELNFDHDEE